MSDLVKVEEASLATVLGVTPKAMMKYAVEIADTLTEILRDRNMTQKFGKSDQEHVKSEGWQLAGSLMGFTASEGPAKELEDGSFEAIMELRSVASGKVLAVASARCGTDETTWKSKPKYARRSMAYTRALGRVYAQNFRWLIHLAGFSGTPAEEMDGLETQQQQEKERIFTGTTAQQKELAVALDKRNIDESIWETVGKHMQNKPISGESLQKAIDLAIADAGKI